MYQRLLMMLTVLFFSGTVMAQDVMSSADADNIYNPSATAGSATNPTPAAYGVMQKWVHDTSQTHNTRIKWDQSKFKSYRFNSMSFRLRFPKNYDPTNNQYPLVIFFHGAGEACDVNNSRNLNGTDRENQDQLYWGASDFSTAIENNYWNGFLLFPQLYSGSTEWDINNIPTVVSILDTLVKYNGLDIDRIITMGLSAGGLGSLNCANLFPTRVASVVTSSPEQVQGLNSSVNNFVQIPIWMAAGGQDNNPDPANALLFRDNFGGAGGDIYLSYYANLPHQTWDTQWNRTDNNNNTILYSYWKNAHKAQPLLYYQNNQFCAGGPISAQMGISPGFYAYEWQLDNGGGFTTIAGATNNTYTATKVGSYRVHFKRSATSDWSAWSPIPIAISTKACNTTDTAFVEHFNSYPAPYYTVFPGSGVKSNYGALNTGCQNGLAVSATESFSQDALLNKSSRFLLFNTQPTTYIRDSKGKVIDTACGYHVNDQVWRSMDTWTVTPHTDYTFSFYLGNQSQTNMQTAAITPYAQIVPYINDAPLTNSTGVSTVMQGDVSWKKYSYTWNSGENTYAYFGLRDQVSPGVSLNSSFPLNNGNDFAIDEISLVKAAPAVMPAGVNTRLWSQANKINSTDGSIVKLWNNNDVNGNNLVQTTPTREPSYKNNSTDNINFNPAVAYSSATATTNFVSGGFASSGQVHNSVHAYFVLKAKSISSGQTIFSEGRSSGTTTGTLSFTTGTNGSVTFNAGTGGNLLSSNNNVNDLNKPTLWTLSKDNTNGTGDGNKQDIRKNGAVIATSSSTSTFTTGTNNIFRLGASPTSNGGSFNGNIAEVIYLMDTTINTATENKLESYLAVKYGITLGYKSNAVAYTASDGTVIWPATNAAYHSDVFGIGVDSLSGLIQTTSNSMNSGSGDGTGQSARGNLVLSANTATALGDKDFLMIGSDSASLAQSQIALGQASSVAVGSTRVGRNWKVVNTGNVGKVDLSFDTTGLGNQTGGTVLTNYALMIDNDGDGNFATGTTTFYTAKSASGKKIMFSGATLNNGVVFTILTNLSTALPAVWLGFTAEALNGNALLNWKTSDEINVDRYIVEHSYNGVSFSVIGSVDANNATGVNNYSYTDKGLSAGIHYYRIRRIDKDGKSEYSEIKTVKISTTGANVQIRPNPVVGSTLTLAVTVPQANKTMLQIISVDGKVMMQQQVNLSMGSNLVTINVNNVPSGIYLLRVQLNDGAVTSKFIRQH